ncbi:glycosyltransferase [Microbacterium sp. NPDC089189]|uniref:glycosyltransferase n=1 Tax=Microbacterium sp. NPDC089189 TaxID=3154972 RepID=UPI00341E5AEF
MTLLVISPDYASHLLPLVTLAGAWRDAGHDVIVATGPATAPIVTEAGFRRIDLSLGRGANAGVMRTEQQQSEEAASLAGFFAATRRGMIETLTYQAQERSTDLMWEPVDRARRTLAIIDEVAPDAIIVDHLAFSARMALHTAGIAYADVVLGHPTALPVAGERYGCPPFWPAAFRPEKQDVAALAALCADVSERFTAQWNRAAAELDAAATPVADAFSVHGDTVLYNYPRQLAEGDGRTLPSHVFLGSTLRGETVAPDVTDWIAAGEPYVYVSFGSFLSVRDDVLARVAEALRRLGVRAAIATGATDPASLGTIPSDWLVRDYLPQVRLLQSAGVAVTHGGNNSVTEAVAQGVPLVVLPFSTDQFAGAAALERTGAGVACDPNAATVSELAEALATQLAPPSPALAVLADIREEERRHPGPQRAYAAWAATR